MLSNNPKGSSGIAIDFTEKDTLSLGLRYDNFEKRINRKKDGFNFPGLTPYTDTLSDSKDFDSFSPTLNWERKITEGLTGNIRATYSEKPGGFSAYTITDNQTTFLEEETLSYEIGLLFSPTESWGLNFSAYLNDIKNYQFELPDTASTNYFVENADKVSADGIEIEGYIKPSGIFTFSLVYGLCDAKYDKFDGSGLAGKQVSFIPEHTLAFSLNYKFNNGLYGQVGTKTIGETHYWKYDGSNPTDKIDSYTLLDANLGYEWNLWELNMFGLNLTDEKYYTSLVNNLPGTPGVAGSPRVIGLSISREF